MLKTVDNNNLSELLKWHMVFSNVKTTSQLILSCLKMIVQNLYICASLANPPVECDEANGWEQYQSSCYKLRSNLRKNWVAARTDCLREGGDLVSITSAEEEQYVTSRLDPSRFDLWIGYSTLVRTMTGLVAMPHHQVLSPFLSLSLCLSLAENMSLRQGIEFAGDDMSWGRGRGGMGRTGRRGDGSADRKSVV